MSAEKQGAVEITEAELDQVNGGSARVLPNNLKQIGLGLHNYESAAADPNVAAIKAE